MKYTYKDYFNSLFKMFSFIATLVEMLTGESELTQTIADKFIEYKK